jgi:hypothetical protein
MFAIGLWISVCALVLLLATANLVPSSKSVRDREEALMAKPPVELSSQERGERANIVLNR